MNVLADLQIHSRFSRAVSPQMILPTIFQWASRKGIGLMATGDWNHPMWMRDIQENLEEIGNGLLKLKSQSSKTNNQTNTNDRRSNNQSEPLFLLATEVSCIYSQGGKGRRIHILIWVPSLKSALAINKEMTVRGCNLLSDGRPIIGLSAIQLTELVLAIEPGALVIPAHAWTPWFSLYGSMSGFDSINEAFGPYAKHIYAIETGLSSSPDMNWRIKELDNRSILSFSDSHSGPKIGREATVFEMPEVSFANIRNAIESVVPDDKNFLGPQLATGMQRTNNTDVKNRKLHSDGSTDTLEMRPAKILSPSTIQNKRIDSHIAHTIEFYPEEGKYHYSGHRQCHTRLDPSESLTKGTTCSVCGKSLTQGVMQRVGELAGRTEKDLELQVVPLDPSQQKDDQVFATQSKAFPNRPPFVMLVPLQEIIAESIGSPVLSKRTQKVYDHMIQTLGSEFQILLRESIKNISAVGGEILGEGVQKVRQRDIVIDPGYDGVFGVVKIWGNEGETSIVDRSKSQLSMFTP